MNRYVLRCYSERDADGTWFATCIDLNLYARADTPEEAQAKLHLIIADHMESVFALPVEEREHLIFRPAPLSFRLRYAWLLLKAAFGAMFHRNPPSGNSPFRKFDEPSPMPV